MRINAIDRKILEILLRSANLPKAEIARRLGIAPSAISERVRRLEAAGVIRGYETRLDADALGFTTLAFIAVSEKKPTGGIDTGVHLAAVSGVEEVHKTAGRDCFLLKVRARDTGDLGRILDEEINPIPTVAGTATTIVLGTVREDVALGGVAGFEEAALAGRDARPAPAAE